VTEELYAGGFRRYRSGYVVWKIVGLCDAVQGQFTGGLQIILANETKRQA
jgi:hypothetical protein